MNPILTTEIMPIINNSNVDPRDIFFRPYISSSFVKSNESSNGNISRPDAISSLAAIPTIVIDKYSSDSGYKVLSEAKSTLSERGIPSVLTAEDDEISLEWENNNIYATFSYRKIEKNAYFTSYCEGEKVRSRKFIDMVDFTKNYKKVL